MGIGDKVLIYSRSIAEKFNKHFLNKYTSHHTEEITQIELRLLLHPSIKKDKSIEYFDSYRPISLTSVLAKAFGQMLTSRLIFYLESGEIIEEKKAGFSENTKYLEVTFEPKLTWKLYIDDIQQRTEKRMSLLKGLVGVRWGCATSTLLDTYRTFVKVL
ncbi:hypothetical protein CEXT_792261 [Caerostris extrusa]|uniref:Uncharacterized protein n=1 Tax=Caerostris extrusa TaxID=172846 RepID=A0AAV4NXM2_CAEEX|nr:hypothetical protein CEXT_792261 [Caerostris extrusa]